MRLSLSWRFILRTIGVMSLPVSAVWVYCEPDFDSLIALLSSAAAFGGSFAVSGKPIRIAEISEEEKRTRDRRNREAMLRLVNGIWIDGVLNKSLNNAVLIELGLEERKDAVDQPDRPWDMVLQTVDEPNRALPTGTRMVDVFDDVRQALLILGEPGSGKTTTLLELARQTISRAKKDATQPIPVVFNLSSWIDPAQSLADWLIVELNTKYNVARKIAGAWVENDQLLLLLDGLDEVATERRDACVKVINDFRREHLVPIVICSRTAEYKSLTTSLKVDSAVCIQPLTEDQVRDYFDKVGAELTAASEMLQDDEPLRELSRSPLMLNIMALSYQGASTEEVEKLETTEARRDHLFNKYIGRMFNRVARTRNEIYPRDKTIKWLCWLAEKMSQQAQSVFLIERIQPTWLQTRAQQRQYTIITTLMLGLTFGPIYGLTLGLILGLYSVPIVGLIGGLIVGLIVGLIIGLIGGLDERRKKTIKTVESLKWSWKQARSELIVGLTAGLIIGLISGLMAGLTAGPIVGLIVGLIVWLIAGLIVGLLVRPSEGIILGGLSYAEVKERTVPNQGIWQSIKNAAIVWLATLIGSMVIAAPVCVLFMVLGSNVGLDAMAVKIAVCTLLFLVLGIAPFHALVEYGGLSFIQHFILRFILYRNGYIPWNIVRFLDYAADRIFLHKVGGGYKFIHRLIQEHFASRPT